MLAQVVDFPPLIYTSVFNSRQLFNNTLAETVVFVS